jgi:tetratricopeptide (TPR) repeat protein
VWDDEAHVTKQTLRSAAGLVKIWFEPGATQQYYPVVHSAFWLQFQAWGVNPSGYHVVNILLHAASACLLGVILRRLAIPGWWLGAAIFALHPVQVESVAWITELKNTLSGVFYFAAALTYLRFDEHRTRGLYLSALGLFVLALLSKSVTATLPAGLLIVFWWKRGRIDWLRDARPLVPFFVLGVAAGAMTIFMERTFIGAQGSAFNFTFVERVLIAGRAVCFYLWSLIWPANLAFNYPRWQISQTTWWLYLFPLFVAAMLLAAWLVRRKTRAPLAALLFFGVTVGPALGFANVYPFRFSFVADHFQYLASAGIFALVAAAVFTAIQRWRLADMRPILVGVVIVPLALVTWRDAHAYDSQETLWQTTIQRNPDAWLARTNYAAMLLYLQPPDPAQALMHAREAVRIAPEEPSARFNLGLALEATGDKEGAITEFRQALGNATTAEGKTARVAVVHNRLAAVLRAVGRTQEADAEVAIARQMLAELASSGDVPIDAQIDAGIALLQAGQPQQAVDALSRLVDLAPHRFDGRYALGIALGELKRFDEAVAQFQAVLKAAPSHAGAAKRLGKALHSLDRPEEALTAYRLALPLDPTSVDLHNDLGVLLAELGLYAEAEPHFAEAARLDPKDQEAKANLAKVREILKKGK